MPKQMPLPLIMGSQYYRAPTPIRNEWARDLQILAEQGLNTIKIWSQWRWNNPAEGRYVFDDLLELLELAKRYGLYVVVNTIFDVAPAWVYRKYPDCRMLTHDGRLLGPQTLGHRSIGGAPGPCLHHHPTMELGYQYLAASVEALKGAPALLVWDAWNEPELTCAIAREPTVANLVCYCPHSRAAFLVWLQRRYASDLERLNHAWSTNYRVWEEIELPRSPDTFRDMLDWRRFFVETITAELHQRVQIIRARDKEHAVMAHTVPFPIFNLVSCASDDFDLAAECDLFGNSAGSSPQAADLLASAAVGKVVINAEVHALPGSTFRQCRPLDDAEVDHYLLAPLAQEIKGFLFWQYRPELLGNEAPNWGLADRAGQPTPWLKRVSTINRALQERRDFILRARNRLPEVGILLDPENELFHWCITRGIDYLANAVRGLYEALYRANFRITFLHPRTLRQTATRLPAIYCPAPYWLQDETLAMLRDYVASGGWLVAEPYFAGMEATTGWHRQVVPGAGWEAIFGVTQGDVLQPSAAAFDAYRAGTAQTAATGATLEATLHARRHKAGAYHQVVELRPTTAMVLGTFNNGWAGCTRMGHGRGQVYYLGTYLAGAAGQGVPGAAEFVAALCTTPQAAHRPQAAHTRLDLLSDGQAHLLIAQALLTVTGASESVRLHGLRGQVLRDILSGEEFPLRLDGAWSAATLPMVAGQVRALEVR